jgi:hypothetical protein
MINCGLLTLITSSMNLVDMPTRGLTFFKNVLKGDPIQ